MFQFNPKSQTLKISSRKGFQHVQITKNETDLTQQNEFAIIIEHVKKNLNGLQKLTNLKLYFTFFIKNIIKKKKAKLVKENSCMHM